MGHFNACDNRLITIMSKDRKDRKARTARARVSGPGFGPEKLEPDPDRGIYTHDRRGRETLRRRDVNSVFTCAAAKLAGQCSMDHN